MEDEHKGIPLSAGTVRLLIQIVTTVLLVSGWGWSIKSDVRLQGLEQQHQKERLDMMERKMELLLRDVNDINLSLASQGLLDKRGK